jgi:hypothetical protein
MGYVEFEGFEHRDDKLSFVVFGHHKAEVLFAVLCVWVGLDGRRDHLLDTQLLLRVELIE